MKPGRKKLAENLIKRNYVHVSYTDDEYESIKKKAQQTKTNLTAFVRDTSLSKTPKIITEQSIERWRELARSASNLNQIAHKMNVLDKQNEQMTLEEVRDLQRILFDFRNNLIK